MPGKLFRSQQDDAQPQYALGAVFCLQARHAEAAVHLKRVCVYTRSSSRLAISYQAPVAQDRGDGNEAIRTLEDLPRRHPDHALSCWALGSLTMSAHGYTEAENSLEKAVRLNPQPVKANYQLLVLQEIKGTLSSRRFR